MLSGPEPFLNFKPLKSSTFLSRSITDFIYVSRSKASVNLFTFPTQRASESNESHLGNYPPNEDIFPLNYLRSCSIVRCNSQNKYSWSQLFEGSSGICSSCFFIVPGPESEPCALAGRLGAKQRDRSRSSEVLAFPVVREKSRAAQRKWGRGLEEGCAGARVGRVSEPPGGGPVLSPLPQPRVMGLH